VKLRLVLSIILLLIITTSALTPAITLSNTQDLHLLNPKAKIHPILLNDEFYSIMQSNALLSLLSIFSGSEKKVIDLNNILSEFNIKCEAIREGQARIAILLAPTASWEEVAKLTHGVILGLDLGLYKLMFAWATKDDVMKLASKDYVLYIAPDQNILPQLGYSLKTLIENSARAPAEELIDIYKAAEVIGATKVWKEFNITGEGVVVGVVDTGVDFGAPNLGLETIARDEEGKPMILDSDLLGLVLTPVPAIVDENGFINITMPVLTYWPLGYISYTPVGLVMFLTHEKVLAYPVTNMKWYVGNIVPPGSLVKFGLACQFVYIIDWADRLVDILIYMTPTLLVDRDADGAYDTAYFDMSTTWYYLQSVFYELGYTPPPDSSWLDYSFADEVPIYYGNEVAARDFNGDGVVDFSLGTLAGYVYDALGILTGVTEFGDWRHNYELISGGILPGLDPNGMWVDLEYDFLYHGTSCANVVGGRGTIEYDLGYTKTKLYGIAPGAKLAAAPGLWWPNWLVAQLWLSGHDYEYPWLWRYVGKHKVDIITNSWGSSYWMIPGWWGAGFGRPYDPSSLIEDYIVAVTGTVICHAMGNGGPGYGTAAVPGSASYVISVGASTLGTWLYDELGLLPGAYYDVVEWSDRGPTELGTAKPDVVNIGNNAWAGTYTWAGVGDGTKTYSLFGGTSEATPMTAGSVALIIQAYREKYGTNPSPDMVKAILKSCAKDLGFDAYTQGSGHVDVYRAVKMIMEGKGLIAYTYETSMNIEKELGEGRAVLGKSIVAPLRDTQIYTGVVMPGESSEFKLILEGKGKTKIYAVEVIAKERLPLVKYLDLERAVIYNVEKGVYEPLSKYIVGIDAEKGIILVNLTTTAAGIYIPVSEDVLKGVPLIEVDMSVPYRIVEPLGRKGPYIHWLWLGLALRYWIDLDKDGSITRPELADIHDPHWYSVSNTWKIPVGFYERKIKTLKDLIAEYYGIDITKYHCEPIVTIFVNGNLYVSQGMSVVVPIRLFITRYERIPWDWIKLSDTEVEVNGRATVKVTVTVPEDTPPGFYEGYVIIECEYGTTLVPVSVVVGAEISKDTTSLVLTPVKTGRIYENYYVRGDWDWYWRPESGDWRIIPVNITDPSIVGLYVIVTWIENNTNIDVYVVGKGSPAPMAGPPSLVLPGANVGGKITLPLRIMVGFGRYGWHSHYDKPYKTIATTFASTVTPGVYRIVIRNVLISAEKVYPEPYKLTIIPIRSSVKAVGVSLSVGEEYTTTIKLSGPYAMSKSIVTALVPTPGLAVTVEPTILGVGKEHEIKVTIKALEPGVHTAYIIIMNPRLSWYALGAIYNDMRLELGRIPTMIVIPVTVNVIG